MPTTYQPRESFAVLWDMDGVLVDTGEFHFRAWVETLAENGHAFSAELFRATFGMNNRGVLTTVLGQEPDAELLARISEAKEVRFRAAVRGQARPLSGVRAWLARLQVAGARQAVASSAPPANIDLLVDALDLRPYFAALVSGHTLPGKPDPAVFLAAARELGVPPERCIVMEDAVAGVAAARRAGMRCVAVTTTNPRSALAAADVVVDSLEALPEEAFFRLLSTVE